MQFIEADDSKLNSRVYNISGLSFCCSELTYEIKKTFRDFKFRHEIDFRDAVAQSWPGSIYDKEAREDWGWKPICDNVEKLTNMMVQTIRDNYHY